MPAIFARDPQCKAKVAEVYNSYSPSAALVSSTLITAGTKILGVAISNMSNAATWAYFCDEGAATGNISVTSFFALSVEASKTAYQEFPEPFVCTSGCVVKAQNGLGSITSFVFYEA